MSSHQVEKIANMGFELGQLSLRMQAAEQENAGLKQRVEQDDKAIGELKKINEEGKQANQNLYNELAALRKSKAHHASS